MASKSKKLFDQAKKIIPSGVNSPVRFFKPYPFFVKKSQGSTIWDEDGKRYVDYCNGYGALLLGHARKEIISAVSSQLKKGTLYTMFPFSAVKKLQKLFPFLYVQAAERHIRCSNRYSAFHLRPRLSCPVIFLQRMDKA